MKKLLTLAILSFSTAYADEHAHEEGILNKAPTVLNGIISIENFVASSATNGVVINSELVGFRSIKSKKLFHESDVAVYKIPEAEKLKDNNFGCGYEADNNGDVKKVCKELSESEARDYIAAEGSVSVELFEKAAESSVSLFETALGDPKKIKEAKFWRSNINNESNVQVKFVWTKDDGTEGVNYMFCHNHQHGNVVEFDCHRQREAGPNEP
jgi:hypothetical protein